MRKLFLAPITAMVTMTLGLTPVIAFANPGTQQVVGKPTVVDSTSALPVLHKSASGGVGVDPFTATPIDLERLKLAVAKAALMQTLTEHQKAIAQNRAVLRNLKYKGGASTPAPVQNAAAQANAQQIQELQQEVQSLKTKFVAAVAAVHKRQREFLRPTLIGIVGTGDARSALIRIGNAVHSFGSDTSFGQYRVGMIHKNGVMLYGPGGARLLRMPIMKEIGIINASAPMPTQGGSTMGQSGMPSQENALRQHLLKSANQQHIILPPRPGSVPLQLINHGMPGGM